MTHTTHEQSRQRNEKFAEFIKSEEVQEQMKNMKKSKCLQFLRDQFKEKYNISIPASAAYKVMASIDERFKPKSRSDCADAKRSKGPQAHDVGEQRERTPKATWTVKHNETSNETHERLSEPKRDCKSLEPRRGEPLCGERSKGPQAHIVGESTEESVDEIIEEIINEDITNEEK